MCPGRVTVAPRLSRGRMNHGKERREEKEKGSGEKLFQVWAPFGGDLALLAGAIYCSLLLWRGLCDLSSLHLSSICRFKGDIRSRKKIKTSARYIIPPVFFARRRKVFKLQNGLSKVKGHEEVRSKVGRDSPTL